MLVLLVCLVPVVLGQASSPPPKCCIERQFEARLGETGGSLYSSHGVEVPGLIDADNVIHFDYYNRTMVMEVSEHNPDNTTSYTRIIYDQKTGRQYVYRTGFCTTSISRGLFNEPCIPDNAIFLGHSYLGYGVNSIQIDTWQYTESRSGNSIRLAVTSGTCIPVAQATFGVVNNAPSELAFVITNFNSGIRDRSIFQVPSLCTGGSVFDDELMIHPPRIQRAIMAMRAFR